MIESQEINSQENNNQEIQIQEVDNQELKCEELKSEQINNSDIKSELLDGQLSDYNCLEKQQNAWPIEDLPSVEIIKLNNLQRARISMTNSGLDPVWLDWVINKCEGSPSFKYFHSGFYCGQVVNNKRHGQGVLISKFEQKSCIYAGDWQNDKKHGQGQEIFSNGDKYQGSFQNGKREGYGAYMTEKESYEGIWWNGYKHGFGVWMNNKNLKYEGEWYQGQANQLGKITNTEGGSYEGEFKNFLKHGVGKELFKNGDSYQGDYMNGKPDGKGEYIWKDQSKYEGDFCGGLRHGHGFWQKSLNNKSLSIKIENQNAISGKQSLKSECYTGGYVNDKKSGYGVFRWASGAIYEGEYFDDQRQGYGEMRWLDGSCYKGQWARGVQCKKGKSYSSGYKIKREQQENSKIKIEFDKSKEIDSLQNIPYLGNKFQITDQSYFKQKQLDQDSQYSDGSLKSQQFLVSKNKGAPFIIRKPAIKAFFNKQGTQSTSFCYSSNNQDSKLNFDETRKVIIHDPYFTQRNNKVGHYFSFHHKTDISNQDI